MTPKEAFSRVVLARRVELRLKQKDVAEISGSSINYISDVERGESQPSIEKTWAISHALKTKPSELWARAEKLMEED